MMKHNLRFLLIALSILIAVNVSAEENVGQGNKRVVKANKLAEECQPATAQIDLDINNVRTRLLSGGDMWWNLDDAKYEIPKIEPGSGIISVHSLFAGALWIGGIDAGGQLKLAAQTYRQTGNDFWPGPLDKFGSVEDDICSSFDRHWKVNRSDIDEFIKSSIENGGPVPISNIPRSILEWPGRGNPHAIGAKGIPLNLAANKNLAPYFDYNSDLLYNPEDGDYPDVKGDQAIWWVYNDKGDIHSETGGEAIGLEVQTTAFAFATNDEVNDMTFYSYKVSNFSSIPLDSVYFGQWVDADLGYAFDDYVGCDASRALGICYNGDAEDGPAAQSYGFNPPLVGVDFFQGPKEYEYDIDGKVIDSSFLGMSKFLYYNNDFSTIGNPEVASHFYGYLSGTWKNGSPFTEGGNGFGGTILANYIYPDDPGSGDWDECTLGITPADRRFMQSAGPFTLDPGANNEVVIGVVWVRPETQIGCLANFDALRLADDKAQALFDNDFKLIDGPDAPDFDIRELENEIVLSLTNDSTSNNYNEEYSEIDPIIKSIIESVQDSDITDSTYDFEGYIIYQLKNGQISSSEFRDLNKSRPIVQVDLANNVSKIINYDFDVSVNSDVPTLMVDGDNEGIQHTFSITEDAFASGDKGLVNHKVYYFSIVAYAHNNFFPYDPGEPLSQRKAYLEGRKNIKVYSTIPHKPDVQNGGTTLNSGFGDGPQLRRIEGVGNGGLNLDLTQASLDEILQSGSMKHPVYQGRLGPVDVKIFDPMMLPEADFELVFDDTFSTNKILHDRSHWTLRNMSSGEIYTSDKSIKILNEQVVPEIGISISATQKKQPGGNKEVNNGLLGSSKEYADPQLAWLSGIQHINASTGSAAYFNWIRAGTFKQDENSSNPYDDYLLLDPEEHYEGVLDGTWSPVRLLGGMFAIINTNDDTYDNPHAPLRLIPGLSAFLSMDTMGGVDIVFTSDKSKWTQCVVLEMGDDPSISEGNKWKLSLRAHPSLNLDGSYSATENGRSWFPGYAINVETGKRLNIVFGESSWLGAENGNDMIWNPTSNIRLEAGPDFGRTYVFGGKHYTYISNTTYDGGATFMTYFNDPGQVNDPKQDFAVRKILERCTWATMPMLEFGAELLSFEQGLIPTETKVKLRVSKPYERKEVTNENQGKPKYQFSTKGLAPATNQNDVAVSVLDEIRVVPNPYYSYSEYEKSQLDNRVKITNLPASCTISIYTTEGVLIRRFKREVPSDVSDGTPISKTNFDSSLDWNLKNHKNIPISGGMYIIHIEAPGIGEKVVKFFGVMRPIDLDTF